MSDLFEEDEDAVEVVEDDFMDVESELNLEVEVPVVVPRSVDARKQIEMRLDAKLLKEELDDFGDY